jgi:hypothetical protein
MVGVEPRYAPARRGPGDDADAAVIAAAAAPSGAQVFSRACLISNPIFRKVVKTPGRIVVTPSGNITIVCHGQVSAPSIVTGGAPSEAIVVHDAPCFFGKRRVGQSILVVRPSLNVTFACHDNTA